MGKQIRTKKGLNIPLIGTAEKNIQETELTKFYAVKPPDFFHFIPKIVAKPETKVKAGDVLFYNKFSPDITVTAPVSGTVKEVLRGEKRKILEVIIEADSTIDYKEFQVPDLTLGSRNDIKKVLMESGCWSYIRQRPYDIIAKPDTTPKAIFISGFDSAPLAPNYNFLLKDNFDFFQRGTDVLGKLTDGNVFLGLKANEQSPLEATTGVEINYFDGPHPAGNVGVQIHHISPVNKGEIVWHINPQDVVIIGKLFAKGVYDATKIIALVGSEIKSPKYFEVISGFAVEELLSDQIKNQNVRIISGNVLTGTKINRKGFLSFYDNLISVIPEGNYYELFGWALPGIKKYSPSATFFSWLHSKNRKVVLDTNIHGGKRAFVVTGQYEKYLPMDIYPQHLLKAIIVDDIDLMENLGIYEVGLEDFALLEYTCVSKIDIQETLQKGIELMIKEVG
ncbi:MAG: NADH:ubiquinone reductase (Na(+)-transporting) subunit A [Deltaproteobacteria bacterium]|nr:MAG: NADH:ubiquinone reductase (Na(+)-transporting) subunit A [Deltaproteobacteria bacterium]